MIATLITISFINKLFKTIKQNTIMKQERQLYVPTNIAKKSTHFFEDEHTVAVQGVVLDKKKIEQLFSSGTVSQFKKTLAELARKDAQLHDFSDQLTRFLPAVIECRNISFSATVLREEDGSKSFWKHLLQINFSRLQMMDLTKQELASLEALAFIEMPLTNKIILSENNITNYQPLAKLNLKFLQLLQLDNSEHIDIPIRRMQNYQVTRYNLNSGIKKMQRKGKITILGMELTYKFQLDPIILTKQNI